MFKLPPQLLLILLVLSVFPLHGQSSNEIQAFKISIPQNINAFNNYLDSTLIGNWQIDSATAYYNWLSDKQAEIKKSDDALAQAVYFVEMAKVNHLLQHFETSYQNVFSAIESIASLAEKPTEIKLLKLGKALAIKDGNYLHAIDFLKLMESSGYFTSDSTGLSDIIIEIAELYWNMHQYDHSMNYCRKALPITNAQKYDRGKIRALLCMYTNSHFVSTDSASTDYLYQALAIAKPANDSVSLADIFEKLGLAYYRNSDQQTAIEYYKLARSYKEKGSSSDLYTSLLLQLSYTLADSIDAVGELSEFIIQNSKKNNYHSFLSNAYRGRAWYLAKTGKRDSAIYYLDAAFQNRQSLPEKKDASPGFYYYLYEVADLLNDKERALKFLSLSHSQYVNAQRTANASELSTLRANFDYELQTERIERLTTENRLKKEIYTRQKVVLIAAFLILALLLVFMLFARKKYAQIRDSYRELVKKNIELDKINQRLSKTESKGLNGKTNNGNNIKNEEEIYKRLKHLFEKQKIYKQDDISLGKLAKMLHTNTSYLSVIINSRFDESFKTLINKYRINEARRLLSSSEYANYSIEGIAEEVGYHSRSTFYQSFKQITGLTPTQYIETINEIKNSEK